MKLIQFEGNGRDSDIDATVLHMHGADGNDYTLCGITLDCDPDTAGTWREVTAPKVTCPACVAIIRHCRGAKI